MNDSMNFSTAESIAKEGRVYVVGCSIALRKEDIPDPFEFKAKYYAQAGEWINKGDSAIVSPDGEFIAGPLHKEEGLLYAELDSGQMRGLKWNLDVKHVLSRATNILPDILGISNSSERAFSKYGFTSVRSISSVSGPWAAA